MNLIRVVDSPIETNGTAKEKIEEQLGKNIHPTSGLTNKIQKKLCKFRKENTFTNKTYFELYPSDPIPPRLYGTIIAHKPEKNFPLRVIASTIGKLPYGISKYLVDIIQPTLNKIQHKVKNSRSFVSVIFFGTMLFGINLIQDQLVFQ